jgi:YjbE family integral membrane protein
VLTDALYSEAMAFFQVVFIDLVLAGDNAIVVGMAAAGVAPEQRRKVIVCGIAAAVVLRIVFAAATMELMDVIGLLFAGGILLLWVSWKLWRELRDQRAEDAAAAMLEDADDTGDVAAQVSGVDPKPRKTVSQAIWQVALADVSMSLDNVLAVAGAADDHMSALVFGLALSVVLMGAGAALIAKFLQRYHWIGYLGLALIAYVAITMIYKGGMEIYAFAAAA